MRDDRIRKIVWTGLFTALTVVATIAIRVPTPTGGYVNAGDALVILSAFILGPGWGAFAAGFGSALADILAGYAIYAPATLIIKALMALVAASVLKRAKKQKSLKHSVIGGILAELVMITGYYLFTAIFMTGSYTAALAEIPGNAVQAVFGIVVGTSLFYALMRIPYVREHF